MDMKDSLPGVAICVEYRSVSTRRQAAFLGDGRGAPNELAHQLIVFDADIVERGNMALRHDEHMRRCLRFDVVEGDDAVVLVDERRGESSVDDFAEEAVGHGA